MAEFDHVELMEDEAGEVIGIELWDDDRIGDTGFNIVIDGEVDSGKEGRLADEDEVVIFGEVFEEEA